MKIKPRRTTAMLLAALFFMGGGTCPLTIENKAFAECSPAKEDAEMATKGMTVFTQNGEDFIINDPNVANEFSTSANYAVGDHVTYQGNLYVFTAVHAAGAWNAAQVAQVTIGKEIYDLNSAVIGMADDARNGYPFKNNLLDPNFAYGFYVNNVTGEIAANAAYKATTFIQVEEAYKYIISWYHKQSLPDPGIRIAFYDLSKKYISGLQDNASGESSYAFTTPAGAAYLRFSLWTGLDNIQMEVGHVTTAYKKFGEGIISPQNASFFEVGINMVDPDLAITGEYVNQNTGEFQSATSHIRTDYMRIKSGRWYCLSGIDDRITNSFRYAWYTADRTFISGANMQDDANKTILSPNNAAFLVVSATVLKWPIMIAETNLTIAYEPYRAKIADKYLPSEEDENTIILNIPAKIYALVGYETNIYFENITDDWEKYDWDISGNVGMHLKRGYKITPTSDQVGEYTITFKASINDRIYKTVTTTLVVSAADAKSGETETIIVLGDSTTNSGIVIEKLNENFSDDPMNITTMGTRGTSPDNHEGRAGWTLDDYFTKASKTAEGYGTVYNPFYNPLSQTFDASYYFANSGIQKPDWFIINMGINDMFAFTTDDECETGITDAIAKMNAAIASVKSASPDTKIGIALTIPPNSSQDAFGKAYGLYQTRNRYKRNNTLWVSALITNLDGKESQGVYLIPINGVLDTVWNLGMETLPVNARNTEETYESPIANGGVHPAESGYWQIADMYTAFLKAN